MKNDTTTYDLWDETRQNSSLTCISMMLYFIKHSNSFLTKIPFLIILVCRSSLSFLSKCKRVKIYQKDWYSDHSLFPVTFHSPLSGMFTHLEWITTPSRAEWNFSRFQLNKRVVTVGNRRRVNVTLLQSESLISIICFFFSNYPWGCNSPNATYIRYWNSGALTWNHTSMEVEQHPSQENL